MRQVGFFLKILSPIQSKLDSSQQPIFIGISKKCCKNCWLAIKTVDSVVKQVFSVSATHGIDYSEKWLCPNFMKNKEALSNPDWYEKIVKNYKNLLMEMKLEILINMSQSSPSSFEAGTTIFKEEEYESEIENLLEVLEKFSTDTLIQYLIRRLREPWDENTQQEILNLKLALKNMDARTEITNFPQDDTFCQFGSLLIDKTEVKYSLSDKDNYYTADYLNLLLYNSHYDKQIKLYPAASLESLKGDSEKIQQQEEQYALVPLNVAYEVTNQQKNHWIAMVIDKQKKLLYYLDPAQKTQAPKSVLDLQVYLDFQSPIINCPINFQENEQKEGFVRHCGAYVVEIFKSLKNAVDNQKDLSQNLKGILSSIPCGEAEQIQNIRDHHIRLANEILTLLQSQSSQEVKILNPSKNPQSFFSSTHQNLAQVDESNQAESEDEQERIKKNFQEFTEEVNQPNSFFIDKEDFIQPSSDEDESEEEETVGTHKSKAR